MSSHAAALPPLRLIPPGLMIVAATYGLARYTYGLFVPEIQAAFALSTAQMGLIASGSYAGYLAATLLGAWVSGVVGPRLPVVLGGLAATGGMALIAGAPDAATLALGVVLAGTSPGLAYPPLSDAVMRLIEEPRQNRTYAVINAGTSVGVVFAGPAALLAGADWRMAWAAFAVFAAVATLWNARLLPDGAHGKGGAGVVRLRWGWLVNGRSRRLFLAAGLFGIVSSVYWIFAVDLLVRGGSLEAGQSRLFWVLLGAFGLLGGAAGDLTRRFGLRRCFRWAVLALSAATALPAVLAGSTAAALGSAVVFGGGFILVTGLIGIWSVNVFHDRPSAGFGAAFFLLSAGQLLGPALAGGLAEGVGMAQVFLLAGLAGAAVAVLGPRRDLFAMAPAPVH